MFDNLKSNSKKIKRLQHILAVFFEQGFDYLIDQTTLKTDVPFRKRIKKTVTREKEHSFPVKLRLACEELGPTFIKLGQILSLRPDLIPEEYIKEFEKMLDKVPSFSPKTAKKIIEQELNQPIDKIFRTFEEKPIASASLAQVHKAILKNGKTVAVKVQRPNIEETIRTDTEIMLHIARIVDKHFNKYHFHLESIIKEFARWTEREINFEIEASNAIRLRHNHKNSKIVYIPLVYKEYSSKKILTTEFLKGTEINHFTKIKRSKINTKKMVQNGIKAMITQIFDHGFFHADPHPGNIFVMPDNRLAFVDFGIVGEFDDKLKKTSLNICLAILQNDPDKAAKNLVKLSRNKKKTNMEQLRRDLREAMVPFQTGLIKRSMLTNTSLNLIKLASDHNIKIPIDFVLYAKTLLTLEGIALKYDPSLDISKESKNIYEKIVRKQYKPDQLYKNLRNTAIDFIDTSQEIPDYTKDVLERLKSGDINVDIENKDVNSIVSEMQILSGNIAFGVIVGGLVIGSSIMFTLETYRYMAISGYILAFFLTLILLKKTSISESPFQKE